MVVNGRPTTGGWGCGWVIKWWEGWVGVKKRVACFYLYPNSVVKSESAAVRESGLGEFAPYLRMFEKSVLIATGTGTRITEYIQEPRTYI